MLILQVKAQIGPSTDTNNNAADITTSDDKELHESQQNHPVGM